MLGREAAAAEDAPYALGDMSRRPRNYHVYKLPEPVAADILEELAAPPGPLYFNPRPPGQPEMTLDQFFDVVVELRRGSVARSHVTTGLGCWCAPEVLQPCPQCDEPPAPGCWRCAGRGLVEPFDDGLPCVVIHRFP